MVEGWMRRRVGGVGVGVGVAVVDCGWRWDAISASLLGAVFVGIDWGRGLQRRGFEEGKINWYCTFWRYTMVLCLGGRGSIARLRRRWPPKC
jgi:hypothetical protein